MNQRNFSVLLLLWIFSISIVKAVDSTRTKEEFAAAFKSVNNAYLKAGVIKTELVYSVFSGKTISGKALESFSGISVTENDFQYSSQNQVDVIRNKNYQLVADHNTKTIAIEKRRYTPISKLPMQGIDSIASLCTKVVSFKLNGTTVWKVEASGLGFERIELSVDDKTQLLSKILIVYPPSVEKATGLIVQIEMNPQIIPAEEGKKYFEEGKFVSIDASGNVNLKSMYKGYTLLTEKVKLK